MTRPCLSPPAHYPRLNHSVVSKLKKEGKSGQTVINGSSNLQSPFLAIQMQERRLRRGLLSTSASTTPTTTTTTRNLALSSKLHWISQKRGSDEYFSKSSSMSGVECNSTTLGISVWIRSCCYTFIVDLHNRNTACSSPLLSS